MGKIYLIMGKSASGKDTIYQKVRERNKKLLSYVAYTTRPMRDGETEGVEYHFVNPERIERAREEGRLIESRTYSTVYGPWTYATIDDGQIDASRGDYLVPGTLESYISLRDYFGPEMVYPIYVEVEDGLRLKRAIAREEKQEVPKYAEMCRRFLTDSEDFSEEKLKAAGITRRFENNSLEECVNEIVECIAGSSR
ncbi:MAG: guanylate kinase [Eubacteriales bacterium]|nr:guanylate kinase [Eubacteriales bacterium]